MWEKYQLIPILAILAYLIILGIACYFVIIFYACDDQNCRLFNLSFEENTPKEQALTLLENLCYDTIWPLAFVGATILTCLSLWLVGAKITVMNYAIGFIVNFLIVYLLFSFMTYHYLYPVRVYLMKYINSSCPDTINNNKDLGITFTEQ